MTDAIGSALVSIIMAIIGVAIIAVLVSQKAQTANVLQAGGTAVSKVLGSALSPVTGSTGVNIGGISLS
jgi:hypothetical protein